MAASDSDDDKPLGDIFKPSRGELSSKRSDSGSPLPDWLSDNASPIKTPLELLSESDDVVELASDDEPGEAEAGPGPSSRHAQKGKAASGKAESRVDNLQCGKRKRNHKQILESSEEEEDQDAETANVSGHSSARKRQKAGNTTEDRTVQEKAAKGAAEQTSPKQRTGMKDFLKAPAAKPNGSASLQERDIGAAETLLETEHPGPQLQQRETTGQPKAADSAFKAETGAKVAPKAAHAAAKAAVIAPVAGEIPIMLPENLPPSKYIVELEAGNDSAMDLAGDAGVVGRWLVEGDDKNPFLKMDLKGVVYAATTVPCSTTLCVVNLSATEARVEALASQYIQLRPESRPSASGDDDGGDNYFMYDDDDNYQYEASTQNREQDDDGEGGGARKAGAKKKQRAGAGPAAKKPPGAAKRGAAAKPAKKKPGKAKAVGGAKGKGKK